MSTISTYTYTTLDSSKQELRLINLLPSSNFDDSIQITISHSPFIVQNTEPKPRLDLRELKEKFEHRRRGDGMVMDETIEGRILIGYWHKESKSRWSTWEHGSTENGPPQESMRYEPKFEALSYTWGSNVDRDTVLVLDEEESKGDKVEQRTEPRRQLDVNQNLAIVFKHLRYGDRPRRMWIDAICIYLDRRRTKYHRNLRLGPLFSERFRFALVSSVYRLY